MKVLITGATGYIGSRVVDQALAQGHEVVGLCRNEAGANILRTKGVEPLIGDIREFEPIEKAAREVDGILHLAFNRDFNNFEESNNIDKNLVNAFHRAFTGTNKPVVVSSGTLSVFGETKLGQPCDDAMDSTFSADSPNPRAREDAYCLELATQGLNICAIRLPPFVYGHNGSGVVALIECARKSGFAPYIGDGMAKVTAVHVDDAASAYVLALMNGKAGQGYHAVSENEHSFRELAQAAAKLVGVEVKSVTQEEAATYFGAPRLAWMLSVNHQATGTRLAADCGWQPSRKTSIIQDVAEGSYTADAKINFL